MDLDTLKRVLRTPLGAALALLTAASVAAWFAFPLPEDWRTAVLDVLWPAAIWVAGFAALAAFRTHPDDPARRAFLLLGLGAIAWGTGEAIWGYYEVIANRPTPFPSLADVGYLGAVPFLAAGLLLWPREGRRWRRSDAFEIVLVAAVVCLFSASFVISPILREGVDGLAGWLGLAYPVTDVVLLTIVAAQLLVEGWHQRGRLVFVAAGLAGLVVADTGFAIAGQGYATGEYFDLGWMLGFAFVGFAALLPTQGVTGRKSRAPELAGGLILTVLLGMILGRRVIVAPSFHEQAERAALSIVLMAMILRHLWMARTRLRESRRHQALALVTDPQLRELGEPEVGHELLVRLLRSVPAYGSALILESEGGLDLVAAVGIPEHVAEALMATPLNDSILVGGRTVALRRDDRSHPLPAEVAADGVRCALAVPLHGRDSAIGILYVLGRRPGDFGREQVAILETLAGRVARQMVLSRTHDELERAHAVVRKTLEATPTGMCVFHGGTARLWNSAFLVLLDLDPEPSWNDFVARLDADARRAAELGEVVKFWTPDQRYLAVRFSALPSGELLVSVDDLTGQERERAIRDRFVAEVVSAQEREARRIAELLHDDAVQQLTALGLRLELSAMQHDEEWLSDLARDANTITASLRGLLVELHPAVLESRGLGAALEVIVGNLRAKRIETNVQLSDARIAQELEHLAYRVAQEIVSNVVRHAGASRVEVDLTVADGVLRCRIADDGVGFEPKRVETAVGEGRLGLYLARERVEQAGGKLVVESAPGRGTSVQIELPARAARAKVLEEART